MGYVKRFFFNAIQDSHSFLRDIVVELFRVVLNQRSDAQRALRRILSSYLDQAPEQICFEKNPHGKLLHPKIFFSLSHSHHLALIAISKAEPIGVDIEYLREVPNQLAIAKRFFSPCEDPEKTFFEIWTAKEALVKAHGQCLIDHIHNPVAWDRVVPILGIDNYVGHLAFQNPQHDLEVPDVSDFTI